MGGTPCRPEPRFSALVGTRQPSTGDGDTEGRQLPAWGLSNIEGLANEGFLTRCVGSAIGPVAVSQVALQLAVCITPLWMPAQVIPEQQVVPPLPGPLLNDVYVHRA